MGRIILLLDALVFVTLGSIFLIIPARMAEFVDIVATAPAATADVRAVYGGMEIGVGLFLLWCGLSIPRVRTGLLAASLILACVATGRLFGIVNDTDQPAITFINLAVEIFGAAISVAGLVMGTAKTA